MMANRTTRTTTIASATIACLVALGLVLLGYYRIRVSSFAFDWNAARAGVNTVVAETGRAALVTWLVIGTAVLALARWLRRGARRFSPAESLAGALILLWTASYLLLLGLGPLGLYQPV